MSQLFWDQPPPRDTVKEGGATTLSDGKPGSLHPPPGVEGVALPVYRGLGGAGEPWSSPWGGGAPDFVLT